MGKKRNLYIISKNEMHAEVFEIQFLVISSSRVAKWRKHTPVTDLVKPDLVGYFALPGGILTSLASGGFSRTPG